MLDPKSSASANVVINATHIVAIGIMLVVWFTFGLAIWIALMARLMITTTVVTTVALIGGGNPTYNAQLFDRVARMWPDGITRIVSSFNVESNPDKNNKALDSLAWTKFFFDLLYACFFYLLLFLTFRLIMGSISGHNIACIFKNAPLVKDLLHGIGVVCDLGA